MTDRRRRLAAMAVLAVLTAGCPFDRVTRQPQLINATDDTVWYQVLREPGTSGRLVAIESGRFSGISGHTDPCLSFDTLRITANDPAEVDDPEVLLEHDLQDQPVCEGERWAFNGEELVRSE